MSFQQYRQFLSGHGDVPVDDRDKFFEWVRKFLLRKNEIGLSPEERLDLFMGDLRADLSNSSAACEQAERAVRVYLDDFLPSLFYGLEDCSDCREDDVLFKLILDKVQLFMSEKGYSETTIKIYCEWMVRYFKFCRSRNCDYQNSDCIAEFVNDWEHSHGTASATKNQALNALLYLFSSVFDIDMESVKVRLRQKTEPKLPFYLESHDLHRLFGQLTGVERLMVEFLFGTGVSLLELVTMRIRDVDFVKRHVHVRSGSREDFRTVVLPEKTKDQIGGQIEAVRALHAEDLRIGHGTAFVADEIAAGAQNDFNDLAWQYLFPGHKLRVDQKTGLVFRDHTSPRAVQTTIKAAAVAAGIEQPVTAQTLRHSFAVHMLRAGIPLRTLQKLLGHKNLVTTAVYKKVLEGQKKTEIRSPLDFL